jgi:probable F420-dependent oxidoreductase
VPRFKVGVQLWPQRTTVADLRRAWLAADALDVDSIWTWDHFFPIYGGPAGSHFEGWTLLAAMAATTTSAQVGVLVTANPYRNPDLLADMARTVDHLSGGRAVLGIGAGWFQRDHDEYGYRFGTAPDRLRDLEASLRRIRARLAVLDPPPLDLPLLIGGSGERVTLRLVAEYARMWNTSGPVEHFAAKNAVLDDWCRRVGRDPAEVERTVSLHHPADLAGADDYLQAGAQHVIVECPHPFDLAPVERLLAAAR